MCIGVCIMYWFFFFKQKTAYEMRISDWSSDVCSSDLARLLDAAAVATFPSPIIGFLALARRFPVKAAATGRPIGPGCVDGRRRRLVVERRPAIVAHAGAAWDAHPLISLAKAEAAKRRQSVAS